MDIKITNTVWMGDHQNPWVDVVDFTGATVHLGEEWVTVVEGVGDEAVHTYFRAANVYKIEQSSGVEAVA